MSKTQVVEIIQDNGNDYGQTSSPDDIMKSQEFARQHVEQLTVDYLNSINPSEIAGCDYSLQGLMNIDIAFGRIYQYGGRQYEAEDTSLTLADADADDDRIDLIVAVLSEDVPSSEEFVPFQRLRTAQELSNGDQPYPPTEFQRARELHHKGVIAVKAGTPAANPIAPNPDANEVPLYSVLVEAASTAIDNNNVTDLRTKTANLAVLQSLYSSMDGDVAILQGQMVQALAYELLIRDFTTVLGLEKSDSLLNILKEIYSKLFVLKYRYPTIVSADGRCPATARQDGSTWVVDIPLGTLIQFGDGFVGIYPENFADGSLNARYATVSGETDKYNPLLEGESSNFANNNAGGNVVRFDVPATEKTLTMLRDGSLVLRDTPEPSDASECLLLKITPNGSNAPNVKRYVNFRNGVVTYSGTYDDQDATTKQFELDTALPIGVGHADHYGIKAADNSRYELQPLSIAPEDFDGIINVPGITNGDDWKVVFYFLSHL